MSETKFVNVEVLNKTELQNAVRELMDLNFPQLTKIRIVARKKEQIIEDFIGSVNKLPQDQDLPELVVRVYNFIVDNCVEKEGAPKEEKVVEKEIPKEEVAEKPKKKKGDPTVYEKTIFGHRLGSQAAVIDEALINGTTLDELVALGCDRGNSRGHINHLKNRGFMTWKNENAKWFCRVKTEEEKVAEK